MVFEWGMADTVSSRTMRADNYALSEATKRVRDEEQAHLTDGAYDEAVRLLRSTAQRSIGSRAHCSKRRRSSATSCSSSSRTSRASRGRLRMWVCRASSPTEPGGVGHVASD